MTTPSAPVGPEPGSAANEPRPDRFRDSALDWAGRAAIALFFALAGTGFMAFALRLFREERPGVGQWLGVAAIGALVFAIGVLALSGRVWVASLIAWAIVVPSFFRTMKPNNDALLLVAFAWITAVWPLLCLLARRKQVLWPARVAAILLVMLVMAAAPSRLVEVRKSLDRVFVSKGPIGSLDKAVGRDVSQMRFQKADGTVLSLDTPGKLYLVDFWEEHCRPCIAELPELVRLHQEGVVSGRFELVSVLVGKRPEDLSALPPKLRVAADQLVADTQTWERKLGVTGYPTKFIVRDHRIIYYRTGGGLGAYDDWKAILAHL